MGRRGWPGRWLTARAKGPQREQHERTRTSCTVWQVPRVELSAANVEIGSALMLKFVENPLCSVLSSAETTWLPGGMRFCSCTGGGGGERMLNGVAPYRGGESCSGVRAALATPRARAMRSRGDRGSGG